MIAEFFAPLVRRHSGALFGESWVTVSRAAANDLVSRRRRRRAIIRRFSLNAPSTNTLPTRRREWVQGRGGGGEGDEGEERERETGKAGAWTPDASEHIRLTVTGVNSRETVRLPRNVLVKLIPVSPRPGERRDNRPSKGLCSSPAGCINIAQPKRWRVSRRVWATPQGEPNKKYFL